jgi:hypothetical protein
MSITKGNSDNGLVVTSANTVNPTDYYFTKFVSPPLYQSSLASNTWTYNFAAQESSVSANFPCAGANQVVYVNAYVWRPTTTTKIGTILDGNTAATYTEPSGALVETSEHGTFSGSSVSSMQNGDVIIIEIWFRITMGVASLRSLTFDYNGTTETRNSGTTVSNHPSFLETPENLVLVQPIPQTVYVEFEEA